MHPRLESASARRLACPEGEVDVLLAEGFRLRLLGLMRLGADEVVPLLFEKCRSIHTHGMRTVIDLVWLAIEGDQAQVLEVVESVEPRRHVRAPRGAIARRAIAALELPQGEARRLGLAASAGLTLA